MGQRRFILKPVYTRLLTGIALGLVVWFWPSAWRFVAPALSPFLAISSALAVRTLSLSFLLAVPMLVLAIFRRRFWCRNLCPVGLISETCGKVRAKRTQSNALPSAFPVARLLVLLTLGGALVGYPVFIWMDPLALFSGSFSLARVLRAGISPLSAAGLPIVILISFLFPGLWCSRICPLGGTQDLLNLVVRGWKRNGREGNGAPAGTMLPARRVLIGLGVGVIASAVIPKGWARKLGRLRPPGSVDESTFQGTCIRCGSCVRVCPTGIIEPSHDAGDAAGYLVPRLRFEGANYCRQDCNSCGQVCPPGVIQALPLEAKNRYVIGTAVIDLAACRLTEEVECGVCLPRCPRGAIEEIFSYETYTPSLRVLSDKCNGCGACVGICPPKVIRIVPADRF
ncbi:MAG: 4Fe-4S binding protein [Bryobacteraceae bacterium]